MAWLPKAGIFIEGGLPGPLPVQGILVATLIHVQVLLKARKHGPNLRRTTQVGQRISNRVVVLESQQWRELFGVPF